MNRLGLNSLSVFGMPPVDYVRLAAELGCGHVSATLLPLPWNPLGFPSWSLRDDAALRREMRSAMRDLGVSIAVAEGFTIQPDVAARERAADLDLIAELGAGAASTVIMDPDPGRALAAFATLADLCAERGLAFWLEFAPPHPVGSLQAALDVITASGRPNTGLVLDAMHCFRSGATTEALAAIDPGLIGYAQLCDVPLAPQDETYLHEACFRRRIPGEGEAPLAGFVAALPGDLPIGLEIPMIAAAEAGELAAALRRAVTAARDLLDA